MLQGAEKSGESVDQVSRAMCPRIVINVTVSKVALIGSTRGTVAA